MICEYEIYAVLTAPYLKQRGSKIIPSGGMNSRLFLLDVEDRATAKTVEVDDATGALHRAVKFKLAPRSSKKWTISMWPCKKG